MSSQNAANEEGLDENELQFIIFNWIELCNSL